MLSVASKPNMLGVVKLIVVTLSVVALFEHNKLARLMLQNIFTQV
jgi:hypothetical protein